MDAENHWIGRVLANIHFSSVVALLAIISSIITCYEEARGVPGLWHWVLSISFVSLLVAVGIYSIRVRQANIAFRKCIRNLHKINHEYRDILVSAFKSVDGLSPEAYELHLKRSEKRMIRAALQKIEVMYNSFTHAECMVTVKLTTKTANSTFCETYERSEEHCLRDEGKPCKYNVGTGENTAFDQALLYSPGRISHYHSSNLIKERKCGRYRNSRDNWDQFYQCTIVVPIRAIQFLPEGDSYCSDDIGYLCVDTLSTYRLNNSWHVELLASFADQMYNFLSLMRGKYALKTRSSL